MLDPLDDRALRLLLALLNDPAAMRRALGPDRRRLARLRAPVVRVRWRRVDRSRRRCLLAAVVQ